MPTLSEVGALAALDWRGVVTLLGILAGLLALGWLLAGRLASLSVHSTGERGLVWLLVGTVGFSWVGVILAALRLFRWWALLLALLGAILVARRVIRDNESGTASSPTPTPKLAAWAVLAVLGIALWLFARPAQSYFLVDDSAVYTLGGIILARDGSLLTKTGEVLPVTADFARSFYVHNQSGTLSRFYGPFYQYLIGTPELELGFLPLPKVWSALMVWLLGATYATWATPLFGVLGLATLYGFARRTVGWQAALISALLLTVSLPQIWFARYPISEMYAQATLWGAFYLALLARTEHGDRRLARQLAFWSAACLALWSVTRLESVVLLPLLAVVLLVGWGRVAWSQDGHARTWLATLLVVWV